jgi:hypothetical protein
MEINEQNMVPKYSPVIKWSLVIGIVIVLNLFFNYFISLVYKSPDYNVYCPQTQVVKEITDQKTCVDSGGQWNPNTAYVPEVKGSGVIIPAEPRGYCDQQFICRTAFETANKSYERNVFITLVVLGVIFFGLSFVLVFNWILSVSFSMGGILSIIIASMRYWSSADNLIKVVILFLALAALIYYAIKKFKN